MHRSPTTRSRSDLCPGVFRPWPADDGALTRLRLIGGRITATSLTALSEVAQQYGDGDLHLTRRANLQLRALPATDEGLAEEVVHAIEASGLLPSRTHELVRNVMVSPQTGLAGGRADLLPVADELDRQLCAAPSLASLPGRFLFVLDDGRGDLADRSTDLGLLALDSTTVQLRIGSAGWGPVVVLGDAATVLTDLAQRFLDLRGTGPQAPWHVDELSTPLAAATPAPGAVSTPPLPFGPVAGGLHICAPDGLIDPALAARLTAYDRTLVVTPWHGILLPGDEVDPVCLSEEDR